MVGWVGGWLAGWLAAWLAGWLAGASGVWQMRLHIFQTRLAGTLRTPEHSDRNTQNMTGSCRQPHVRPPSPRLLPVSTCQLPRMRRAILAACALALHLLFFAAFSSMSHQRQVGATSARSDNEPPAPGLHHRRLGPRWVFCVVGFSVSSFFGRSSSLGTVRYDTSLPSESTSVFAASGDCASDCSDGDERSWEPRAFMSPRNSRTPLWLDLRKGKCCRQNSKTPLLLEP